MNESAPGQKSSESDKDRLKREYAAIGLELMESGESFPFPGIEKAHYDRIKSEEEEYPGFATPIDELLKRFKEEGLKMTIGKHPASGNVFILPAGSDDIEMDSLLPKHLVMTDDMDERLKELIRRDRV